MELLDATGKACPLPVIETKKALEAASAGASLEVVVDNSTAVENLAKFAEQRGYAFARGTQEVGAFHVVLTKGAPASADAPAAEAASEAPRSVTRVVVVASRTMGEGDERLGSTLLKGFLYALTEQTSVPDALLFYNGGAFLTTEGSESVPDLLKLEAAGTQVLTCGTCLNHYGLADQLSVGGVTNMYTITELLVGADVVIKP